MKEDFFVPTLLKIFAAGSILIFVLAGFQHCRPTRSWQRSLISEIPFEKQKWLDDNLISGDHSRPGMARELVNKKVLIGKTREEIYEMLGKGSEVPNSKFVTYDLEEIYRLDIDPVAGESLVLFFDEADKVEKAEISFYNSSY